MASVEIIRKKTKNTMKHSAPYLFIAFLIVLLAIFLFHPASKTESNLPLHPVPVETTINDSLLSFQKKSDTLNTNISNLKRKNEQLKANYLLQQKHYLQKIKETEALPADSQLLVFKETTGCTENLNLKMSAAGDTTIEIPLKSIRTANLKLVELEATGMKQLLLELTTANQDSLISMYKEACLNAGAQIELLTRHDEQQHDLLRQKDSELKKQKATHRLELLGAGALIALIIIF